MKLDPGRRMGGGLGWHFQVYEGNRRLPGIITLEGDMLRHANQDPDIPNKVMKFLRQNKWIGAGSKALGIIAGLILVQDLNAPTAPCK